VAPDLDLHLLDLRAAPKDTVCDRSYERGSRIYTRDSCISNSIAYQVSGLADQALHQADQACALLCGGQDIQKYKLLNALKLRIVESEYVYV
jgi:hypothetical protein